MVRKYSFFVVLGLVIFAGIFPSISTEASSLIKGTFVDVTYEEIQIDEETVETRLVSITIQNSEGRTTTLNIDKNARLYINSLPTTIDAFKYGMEVEADVNLRRVKELRGQSGDSAGEIDYGNKVLSGTINQIDKKGKFLSIRLDDGTTKTFYLNSETLIFKGTTLVDLSVMYEGDRVKLTFDDYQTNYISEINVNEQGVKIEALYKGKIQSIEPLGKKITVTNETMFSNWKWGPATSTNKTYSYSKTPIYVGNEQIREDRLRYYKNHDVYYVTVSQFGKQIIEKMVIKKSNERTFYEPMNAVNLTNKWVSLNKTGKIKFHNGTILIRNGRLVDAQSLQYQGSAFTVTDGAQKSQYANIIHITNDGFQSPNLANHEIYYGRIQSTGPYKLTLNNTKVLSNNYWNNVSNPTFAFSNDTVAVKDLGTSFITIFPGDDEMVDEIGKYGYFYVANNHIVALHLTDTPITTLVSVGRLEYFLQTSPSRISVRNVSQWQNGVWIDAGRISSMNIEQATIIRDGKIISIDDLHSGERLFILHESKVKGRIIFVN